MAKRTVSRSRNNQKKSNKKATAPRKKTKAPKAVKRSPAKKSTVKKSASSLKATRKRAARLKAIEVSRAAEQAAAATVNYAPAPFEESPDPSKAPGKQHRHPPVNDPGPKHSQVAIPRMRAPFNRRMNIGR